MEHEKPTGEQPLPAEHTGEYHIQEVINDVLRLSLKPYLFKELIERILGYLVSRKQLHFAPRAAVLLVEPDSQHLTLKASYGLSEAQKARCSNVKLGLCHCGRAALNGTIHFFVSTPPLRDPTTEHPAAAGHYCIPIIRDKQPIGVLALYVTARHELSAEMEQMLESIANILVAVIESQNMDQQLLELVNDLRISIVSLREEKLFSESIIQSLNHGLIVTDLHGNILKSNSAARQILQPFASNLDGQNLNALVGSRHAARLSAILDTEPDAEEKKIVLSTADGEKKILSFSTGPRKDAHGNQVGVIISLTDVTELRFVRKEMEKMNRLSTVAEIASAVAHEVRNPLAGIKIMAQSIEEDAADNEQQLECSRRIIRQVDRLNELLTEFFSYARPVVPNKRPTSLGAILAETCPLISNRLIKNAIELNVDIPPDLPHIIADPNQMQQVFLNLILNSIDAIRQNGTIAVNARLLNGHKLGAFKKKYSGLLTKSCYVLVNFSDNGSGMPADVAEKVFEPFFTTKTSGTGLGLSIVYRTLHENGAVIVLESRQGQGTTFNMFFQTGT